jgi:iron-sulfur cluster assembly protein
VADALACPILWSLPPEMPENAELYEDNGVKVVVEKKSTPCTLIGTTLEYSGGLNGKGFSFNNP